MSPEERNSAAGLMAGVTRHNSYITTTMRAQLLTSTPAGLYCEAGGFHIDPPAPVARALITHAHADHARPGHGAVLATPETLDLMRLRYGEEFAQSTQP